jgi:hypothetical protein
MGSAGGASGKNPERAPALHGLDSGFRRDGLSPADSAGLGRHFLVRQGLLLPG